MSQVAAATPTRPSARRAASPAQRRDPAHRFNDVTASWSRLQNRDPGRFYVYVYKGSFEQGPEYYEAMGYDYERAREGGVKPFGKLEEGSVIERRGHVLMSCTLEHKQEIEQFGPDGISGQARIDEIEAHMIKNRGAKDHLRGQRGQIYATAIDDTTAAELE